MRLTFIRTSFAILLGGIATSAHAQTTPSGGFLGLEMKLIPVASTGTTIGLALRDFAALPTWLDSATHTRLRENGFRVISNTGRHGVQDVPHLHVHIIGGRPLGRMLSKAQ